MRNAFTRECRDEESEVIEHFICVRTEKALAKVVALRKISLSKYLRCKALGKYFQLGCKVAYISMYDV